MKILGAVNAMAHSVSRARTLDSWLWRMDELAQLESLNLVAKVCTELENHIGINDKVLGTKMICCCCCVLTDVTS